MSYNDLKKVVVISFYYYCLTAPVGLGRPRCYSRIMFLEQQTGSLRHTGSHGAEISRVRVTPGTG